MQTGAQVPFDCERKYRLLCRQVAGEVLHIHLQLIPANCAINSLCDQ